MSLCEGHPDGGERGGGDLEGKTGTTFYLNGLGQGVAGENTTGKFGD